MASIFLGKILNVLKKLPDNPGIYLFYSAKKELIYVGKATSLKSRVMSGYFRGQRTTRPIEQMMNEVADIKWKETDSVLEAIILEAEYIKKFQPKYNVDGKDDKSWNYIVVTRDKFPKVETMREREYESLKHENIKTCLPDRQALKHLRYIFGPYPGLNTKAAMKLLRRMFRFSNCAPNSQRPCLYRQMGWCPGVCAGEISPIEYSRQVIRPLAAFLSGRKKQVIKMFESEMKRASRGERYEDAARLRDQLKSLQRIQDVALLNKSFVNNERLTINNEHAVRIEGYDISNLGASEKVGSMVVFNQNGPVKSEYRKFIIKTVPGQSDIDSLAEVLRRRFHHPEWQFPSVVLVDGGRCQVARAIAVLEKQEIKIPVVGIAKGSERKRNDFILGSKKPSFVIWVSKHKQLLIQARDEAHRFAITFHRDRRQRWLQKKEKE